MTAARTLRDHVDDGGEWPLEIEPIRTHPEAPVAHARCVCGRVHTMECFVDLKAVPVAERVPGRVRRDRVRGGPSLSASPRARFPEASPRFLCGVCTSAIRRELGITHQELKRKVGAE